MLCLILKLLVSLVSYMLLPGCQCFQWHITTLIRTPLALYAICKYSPILIIWWFSFQNCHALTRNRFTAIYTWISVALNSLVPFTILIILNIFIINAVSSSKKFLDSDKTNITDESDRYTEGDNQPAKKEYKKYEDTMEKLKGASNQERQLKNMLLLVSFALLALTFPQYARHVVYALIGFDTPDKFAVHISVSHLTRMIFFANNSLNFFLYCLGGSKFRQDVIKILKCVPN